MVSLLELRNVVKSYEGEKVLQDVSLDMKKGEIVSIIGPSGSGKTTLLRCIAGLEKIDNGSVLLDGSAVQENSKDVGFVFQHLYLWPHKTALENISEALVEVKGYGEKKAKETAIKLLERFDLLEKKDFYPENLSGGQQQRVAIARTLAMQPKIILFDEITSALDPELVGEVLKIIKRLAKDGMTMLVVTHHMRFASEISDRIIFLDEGKIVEQDTPQKMFSKPNKKRTKEFLKTIIEKKQEINVYEGSEDFQAYHVGLLKRVKKGCTGYIFGTVGDAWYKAMGKSYKMFEEIREKKKIKMKFVTYKLSPLNEEEIKRQPNLSEFRIVPKEMQIPISNYNIWEDVVIIQIFDKTPTIIEIRNKNLVEGYHNYFKLLWSMGKKCKL